MITSFDENGKLYINGMKEILHYLSEHKINGIWLLGSYGAFPLLTKTERMIVAEEIIPYAKSLNMNIIVHIGSPSTDHAIELAIHAQNCGADALASVVPFYYATTHLRDDHILAHFHSISENLSIPLFFYNNIKATGYSPTNSIIEKLLKNGVTGLKDKGDYVTMWERIRLLKRIDKENIYLCGTTSVMQQGYLLGAQGVTSGTALAEPLLIKKLQEALFNNDMEESKRLQDIVLHVREIQGQYVGRAVSCYDILASKDVNAGTCRMPWQRMSKEQANEILTELKRFEKCL